HGLTLWNAILRMIGERTFPARAQAALENFRAIVEAIRTAVAEQPLAAAIRFVLERSGYQRMLEEDTTPEGESRLENLRELVNAAAEAAERGEGVAEFLDHAALVAEADQVDERAQVLLLTMHNAKGLEFPVVFIAGLEEGLFPHSRSFDHPDMMEEERRLCYVGMTRAEKRLFLTWAKYRRRFGGGEQERTLPSSFLKEVPEHLVVSMNRDRYPTGTPAMDLTPERHEVRETVRRTTYTGTTYNSVENIRQFFAERGGGSNLGSKPSPAAKPAPGARPPQAAPAYPPRAAAPNAAASKPTVQRPGVQRPGAQTPAAQKPLAAAARKIGATVDHPKYGRGTIVRREGEGGDAKITVHFPAYGIKKLVAKYAGLTND
ncbi:MAG: 3'-5' exonuclease, partial [Bryobacteraceae bacterium]